MERQHSMHDGNCILGRGGPALQQLVLWQATMAGIGDASVARYVMQACRRHSCRRWPQHVRGAG